MVALEKQQVASDLVIQVYEPGWNQRPLHATLVAASTRETMPFPNS
jgi:hypothetical protein